MEFFKDIFSDNSNIVTCMSVIVSGLLSLLISLAFHYIGHRDNLKISIINPVVRILEDYYSKQNYDKLLEISKEYSVRYMRKKEFHKFNSLLDSYKIISVFDENKVNAKILDSYFMYVLEKNGVNCKTNPIYCNSELVGYGYPYELLELYPNLVKILKDNGPDVDPEYCSDLVASLYSAYCKKYFSSNDIAYFEDYTLEEVLENAPSTKEWTQKFAKAEEAKRDFLKLKIVNK